MDASDFEKVEQFLSMAGHATLYEYLGIEPGSKPEVVDEALKKKRSWAQGQQANPKFRSEAIWVIKNLTLVRKLLVDEPDAYQKQVSSKDELRNVEVLTLFIRGTLADGTLTKKKAQAIEHQGSQLGLSSEAVKATLARLMAEVGAVKDEDADDEPTSNQAFVDFYAALEVSPDADMETLEKGYRAKYRWARSLRDVKRASEMYATLDEAWRVLKDAERRAAYDERHRIEVGRNAATPPPRVEPDTTSAPPSRPPSGPTTDSIPPQRPRTSDTQSFPAPNVAAQAAATSSAEPPPTPISFGFRDGPAMNSMPPVRPPPAFKAPDGSTGRTLGLGADVTSPGTAMPTPRLVVDGALKRRVTTWSKPQTLQLSVRNAGAGRMSGRVFADRDWVSIEPARLDPNQAAHQIKVTIDPSKMPKSKAVSLITVVADHNERKVVTIEAERRGIGLVLGTIAAVVAAVGLIAAVGWWAVGLRANQVDVLPTRLVVFVDPPAGVIQVGNAVASTNGKLDTTEGLSTTAPVEIKVQQPGFQPWSETVQLVDHQTTTVKARLKLEDAVDWRPPDDGVRAPLGVDALEKAIVAHRASLDPCFAESLKDKPVGFAARLDVTVFVDASGQVRGVHPDASNFPETPTLTCIRRVMRTFGFGALQGGNFAIFTHKFEYTTEAPANAG